jgi:hypothetical protein
MTVRTSSLSVTSADLGINPKGNKTIYWHRELPPSAAEVMGEHCAEAVSRRVPGTLAHRDELWSQCYEDLMAQARIRLGLSCGQLVVGYLIRCGHGLANLGSRVGRETNEKKQSNSQNGSPADHDDLRIS